ncbi:GPR1/FUN34/YaaH family transporter [Geodermatophilus sp. DSM 44513]|uniref:GPR1/FUN34/YaaH family transporter n=1 Tax=Geodermatophilus sp. DSM 44513 TaxID=1528104 RepID=UPI001276AE0E|nr:GPR1/FUN34/YaaH family transporter [Geodermatophilus sp. DSM 44513]WNV73759.1 GPR1/FUN34/YaaH family transporter [Geodermatophilus sp. DSM 44513]
MSADPGAPATRVVLRPLATPLPLGFLALAMATTTFSAVQLDWVPADQGRVAALVAVAATAPLQLTAAVVGFLTRDPVAATGMGVLAGTWTVAGLTTLTSPPGTASPGLGVLLLVSGVAMLVPAVAAAPAKLAPAAVMGTAATRFAVTGVAELTGSPAWQAAAGWVGLALAAVAVYAALALELEGTTGRTVLPVGRRGPGRAAVDGRGPLDPRELAREAGVRPQL